MTCSTLTPISCSSPCFIKSPKFPSPNPICYSQFKLNKENKKKIFKKSIRWTQSSVHLFNSMPYRTLNSSISCFTDTETPLGTSDLAAGNLRRLVSEFKSLPEPIDRVKRLLYYAARLPPLDESARVPASRVTGCTAQVWLDVRMDEFGRIRFGADSDSEITKGFCSCLISALDGAVPEEILKVKTDDLAEMNVGLPGKARSRVNTWHNVLISMHKRTKALIAEREMESFSPSVVCC